MKVAVLMGSSSDQQKMEPAVKTLGEFGVDVDERIMSAHRTPAMVAEFARTARDNDYAAIICGAGMAAHLAGAVAANTTLPVVGVPLSGVSMPGHFLIRDATGARLAKRDGAGTLTDLARTGVSAE